MIKLSELMECREEIEEDIHDDDINKLYSEISNHNYKPPIGHRVCIPKKNFDIREIITFEPIDKLLQRTLANNISKYYESKIIPHNYGFIKGRSAKDGINFILNHTNEKTIYIKTDIKDFFDEIDHKILNEKLNQYLIDKDIIDLVEIINSYKVNSDGKWVNNTLGIPQGSCLSPLLSNIYLDQLDEQMDKIDNCYYSRFADDILLFGEDIDILSKAYEMLLTYLKVQKIKLNKEKTCHYTYTETFEYLGLNIYKNTSQTPDSAIKLLEEKLKAAFNNQEIYEIVNGWSNYYNYDCSELLDKYLKEKDNSLKDKYTKFLNKYICDYKFVQEGKVTTYKTSISEELESHYTIVNMTIDEKERDYEVWKAFKKEVKLIINHLSEVMKLAIYSPEMNSYNILIVNEYKMSFCDWSIYIDEYLDGCSKYEIVDTSLREIQLPTLIQQKDREFILLVDEFLEQKHMKIEDIEELVNKPNVLENTKDTMVSKPLKAYEVKINKEVYIKLLTADVEKLLELRKHFYGIKKSIADQELQIFTHSKKLDQMPIELPLGSLHVSVIGDDIDIKVEL